MSLFVVLEGGEGSGKSTLAVSLADALRSEGRDVVVTREPGGTAAGEQVRALLHLQLTPWAETFAFLLARAELVATVVRPALDRGAILICDRFAASTVAYQGHARGLPLADLDAANRLATGGLEPGLTLFVDLDPRIGLARKLGEVEALRTGQESLAFHERVRAGYRAQLAAAPPGSWVELDGAAPPADVLAAALVAVRERIA
ncbi:MAG: dTMP kinase [Tepidiformaceae bacterium]